MKLDPDDYVFGLSKAALILRCSTRTLNRALDELPDARKPPIYRDSLGRRYFREAELRFWMRVGHMHEARARELERLHETRAPLAKTELAVDGGSKAA